MMQMKVSQLNCATIQQFLILKSVFQHTYWVFRKRFHLGSEQRKTEKRDFRFWPREKWNESKK